MKRTHPIRVALVQHHAGQASDLQAVFSRETGFVCSPACSSVDEAVITLSGHPIDVIVLELYLGGNGGVEGREREPPLK